MPLETGTTIGSLDVSNPAASDGLSQADDHFRLLKTVLKTTFPALNGVLAASHTQLDAAVTATALGATSLLEAGVFFNTDTNTGLSHTAADTIGLRTGGTDRLVATSAGIAVTGTVIPSGQIVSIAGTVAAPGVAIVGELDCGLYLIGAGNVGFAIEGAKVLDISASGLGVTGTLTPTTLGACALTGTYTGAHTLSGIVTFSAAPVFSAGGSLGTGTWSGAATLSGALTLSGINTFSAANTFSSTVALSGGGSLAGTFSGAPTFSGAVVFSGAPTLGDVTLTGVGTFTGAATFASAITFGSTVALGGGGSLAGTFSGAPTLSGNVVFSGTPTLGNVTLTGTGTFTGAVTFASAVTFSAAPTFSGGLALSGTISGAPTFSGNVVFSATPAFTGDVTLTGTPVFTGAATFASALTLSGAITFGGGGSFGTGTFTGAATFSGNLTLSGANTYSGTSSFTNSAGIAARNTAKAFGRSIADVLQTGSFNIASVADQGGGKKRFTFTNAFPNAFYSVGVSVSHGAARYPVVEAQTTTYVDVRAYNSAGSGNDADEYSIICFYNS
jgi:fibronectin-binding autotransporter adhesin